MGGEYASQPPTVLLTGLAPYGGMSMVMVTPAKRIITTNRLRVRLIVSTVSPPFRPGSYPAGLLLYAEPFSTLITNDPASSCAV